MRDGRRSPSYSLLHLLEKRKGVGSVALSCMENQISPQKDVPIIDDGFSNVAAESRAPPLSASAERERTNTTRAIPRPFKGLWERQRVGAGRLQ